MRRKLVGEVQVDTGQLIVADPKHVEEDWDSYAFEDACQQSGSRPDLVGQVLDDRAFVFDTNHGDGKFNIYKVFDSSGRLAKIEIELARAHVNDDLLLDYDDDVDDE